MSTESVELNIYAEKSNMDNVTCNLPLDPPLIFLFIKKDVESLYEDILLMDKREERQRKGQNEESM